MKRILLVAVLSLVCGILFAQTNQQESQSSANVPEKNQTDEDTPFKASGQLSRVEAAARAAVVASLSAQSQQSGGNIDVLSDTQGIDFRPYLAVVLRTVKANWYNVIPEIARPPIMKQGRVDIEFAVTKDGQVKGVRLVGPSGDAALDRAAWTGITASNPFPPLPSEYTGQYLALRFHFYYNPDRASQYKVDVASLQRSKSVKPIQVKIAPALVELTPGASQQFSVKAKDKKATVVWRLSGLDCSGSGCGIISDGLYKAPLNVFVPIHVGIIAEVTDHKGRTGKDSAVVTIVRRSVENRLPQ